jgi:hypothetical protein
MMEYKPINISAQRRIGPRWATNCTGGNKLFLSRTNDNTTKQKR